MDQEGKRTPSWSIHLMLVASNQAACAFGVVQLRRLEARGHKSNRPKRQRAPFRPVRLMLVASVRATCAFEYKKGPTAFVGPGDNMLQVKNG
jgi:hypothetical protein